MNGPIKRVNNVWYNKLMNEHDIKTIDESIAAYKRMIVYIKSQIKTLQLKKNISYKEDCPECFKFKVLKKQDSGT